MAGRIEKKLASGLLDLLAPDAKFGDKLDYEPGSAVKGIGSDAMDMELLSRNPNVPQVARERYQPPRGMPGSIPELITTPTMERLAESAKRGAEIGGMEWYNLEPLRMQYIEKLGPEEGMRRFKRFTEFLAATSPRSKVAMNIRRGSLFDAMDQQGIDFSQMTNSDMPPGYGHIAHETQMSLLRDLANGGSFDSIDRPKTSGFADNLGGNYTPVTVDTHNMAAIKNDPTKKKSPTGTQYTYIEQAQQEAAERLGISPAQWQANVWMGSDTGVADARPFIQVFDEVLQRTAKKRKTTTAKVLDDFIRNGKPLYGMAMLTPILAQLKKDREKQEGNTNGMR